MRGDVLIDKPPVRPFRKLFMCATKLVKCYNSGSVPEVQFPEFKGTCGLNS